MNQNVQVLKKGFFLAGTNGYLVICVHGLGGNAAGVYDLAVYLNRECGIACEGLCLKGHGSDPSALKKVVYSDWIAQAEEAYLALSLRYKTVYLLGNSLGSLVVLALAEKHPCAKVILLSSPIYYRQGYFHLAGLLSPLGLYHVWHGHMSLSPEVAALVVYPKIPYKSVSELNKLQSFCRKGITGVKAPVLAFYGGKDPLIAVEKSQNSMRVTSLPFRRSFTL
jgi:carboxylesterase